MKTYKIVNNVAGWIVFCIAAFTYCSTIEPTASFWDCPEFITTAAKLEVGHPPGAPFFMLLGNLFSQFASDSTQVAKMVNMMSALLSAGCILFLFWSITHLAKKLICKEDEISVAQIIAVMASGVAGALIYTWSDTFWFSAVEGEVYAFSSFLTALVFWLILKWEEKADMPGSDRWLVLIAYLVGLSIGVHLLNLLCIPAMVLVFYYKRAKNPTGKGSLLALGVSVIVIAAVLYGVVPGIVKVGGWFELLFVNQMGLSFNTGLYTYLVLLVLAIIWALWETTRATSKNRMNIAFLLCVALLGIPFYGKGWASVVIGVIVLAIIAYLLFNVPKITAKGLNTTILCFALMVVGYSSYAVIVIRSTANPPMDQNSPEDVFTLGEYLAREQYGKRPLFWGPTYKSQPTITEDASGRLIYKVIDGEPIYRQKEKVNPTDPDEYEAIRSDFDYDYPANQCMLFPRIYDRRSDSRYESWLGNVHSKTVSFDIPGRGRDTMTIPTQYDNMRFFFSYQMNFMYWRYFMWNFAGRQNDIQCLGELEHGNWITGIDFLDDIRLGDQDLLPTDLKENKGHNVFYCLPLILGLLGLLWQAFRGKQGIQQFWVVFFLFFMTGIAIVLYLNQTPGQPRERDYAYAGSFYAFAMWCGLGITAIYAWLEKFINEKLGKKNTALIAALIACIPAVAVPLQMVSQTWDDHDRSDRYMCRDFGLNYLETIPKDGVIFTNGDNDTFPLWYNEDTEGNRTDVRVCNLSYLNTDWYIDQMKRPVFEGEGKSSPLPISWTRLQYVSGTNETAEVNPTMFLGGQEIQMKDVVKQFYAENPELAKRLWGEEPFELTNAIHKFLLKDNIPDDLKDLVKDFEPCLPSDTLYINVDKAAVRKSGMKLVNDSIPDKMVIDLAGQGQVLKSFIMMLEMIGQSNFSRPFYMSTTVGPDNFGNLWRHFVQEGLAWRITPYSFADNNKQQTAVDTEKMYDNMMNKYRYGNLKQPDLYLDETTMRLCNTHRRWFAHLITSLIEEDKLDKAIKALDKCTTEIPDYNVPYAAENGSLDLASGYIVCGQIEKGLKIYDAIEKRSNEYIRFYASLNDQRFAAAWRDCKSEIIALAEVQRAYEALGQSADAGNKAAQYAKMAEQKLTYVNDIYVKLASRAQALGLQ